MPQRAVLKTACTQAQGVSCSAMHTVPLAYILLLHIGLAVGHRELGRSCALLDQPVSSLWDYTETTEDDDGEKKTISGMQFNYRFRVLNW
jgi:hypothetical protein